MQGRIIPALLGSLALGLASCASGHRSTAAAERPPESQLPDEPVAAAAKTLSACPSWKLPLYAHLSHISASADARRILVSTSADHKVEARLRVINQSGRVLWQKDLAQPVKAQALSPDGRLAVVNTYDGKLAAYEVPSGRKLWEHDHLGRPLIFSRTGRVVLVNDDDSEPKTAFTTYDFKGKLVATVAAEHEPLDMDAPTDESFIAVTATDRALLVYAPDGKALWHAQLPGDAVSVRAVGGALPRIYVLTVDPRNKGVQSLSAFEAKGGALGIVWTTALDRRYEMLRVAGDTLFLYGNTHSGQALSALSAANGNVLWRRSYAVPANYSSLVFSEAEGTDGKPFMTAAIDRGVPAGVLHVMAVNGDGVSPFDAQVEASSGLYSYAFAPRAPELIVGAGEPGDGVVYAIALRSKSCTAGR